jgi:hypothetical protein
VRAARLASELDLASLVHRAMFVHTKRALAAKAWKGNGPRLDDGGRLHFDGMLERAADLKPGEFLACFDQLLNFAILFASHRA